ncbi:UNVERIFIED_CONTAM: Retrovirus-related Pol polyprotein from transposon RE1 [Sesamum latifolium]|uniref:Retrovirus-related Pol polyprotein from transposon RE1 n=1 Tax=Sesamum latifolium TaxID=2727402 RepID=A0AAW2TBC2_9LAMI
MEPPEGYSVAPGLVCKLTKSLYGLKQASRQWNQVFTEKMEAFGFLQSRNDYCLFSKETPKGLIMLLVYVDDILVSAPSDSYIEDVKQYLHHLFTIKDLGPVKYFLGIELARSSQGMLATQSKYISDIVCDLGLEHGKGASTPLPPGIKLSAEEGNLLADPSRYRRLVGRILYLSFTRPDVSHTAQQLSQFLHHPCQSHWNATTHLVRYLKGSSTTGMFFPLSNDLRLTTFCDADWAGCLDTKRSLTVFCIFLGTAPISWKTKKQATVSKSTAEAEYRSLASTVCELTWIGYLLHDLKLNFQHLFPYFVTTRLLFTLRRTLCSMKEPNIWRLTVT